MKQITSSKQRFGCLIDSNVDGSAWFPNLISSLGEITIIIMIAIIIIIVIIQYIPSDAHASGGRLLH